MAKEEEIGKVVHYFDKLMVAVVALDANLKVGEMVKFAKKGEQFTQTVSSMQVEHKPVEKARKGTEAAIKVDQPVKRNWRVYKES